MKRVLLSIDFDFFSREMSMWDWGHSENRGGIEAIIWATRYMGMMDLRSEVDPSVHADFLPTDILTHLRHKKFEIGNGVFCEIADSHRHAYDWAKAFGTSFIDEIVNIDAHHDCWEPNPLIADDVSCQDWLTLTALHPRCVPVLWLCPKWKDPNSNAKPHRRNVTVNLWKDFAPRERRIVVGMFLCRSSAWVPPHLDPLFADMVCAISEKATLRIVERITDRSGCFPGEEQVARIRRRIYQEISQEEK